jgi:sugar lactone lactonase YvrE
MLSGKIAVAGLLTTAIFTVQAQTTRYAYTPILTNSTFSNWNGAGKQARDVFLPAKAIAAANDGSVYVLMIGHGRAIRIAPSGIVTEVFRVGATAFGPGVAALGVQLAAAAIAAGPDGLLYFADQSRHRIFRVEADATVSLVAGAGTRGFSGDAGQAAAAELNIPQCMAVGADKTLYFFDSGNNRIRSVDSSGTIRTVAGTGQTGEPSNGALALNTPMAGVIDLAVDGAGNLYALKTGSIFAGTTLWKIEKATGIARLWAGGNTNWVPIANGMQATGAQLKGLTSVAVESDGTAHLAWYQGGTYLVGYVNQVLRVTPAGLLSVVGGAGPLGYSGDGGAALQALLAQPKSITTDRQGSVYLLDHLMVRKIGSNGVITTIGGTPSGPAMGEDGPVSAAQLMNYTTIKTGPDGLLYFAEYFTSTVWKIDAAGNLRRVAGNGIRGFGGDGGPARGAMLDWPEALCFDPQGNLFVFDNGNERIRKVTPGGTISTVVGGATTNVQTDPTNPVLGTQIGDSSPWGCTVDPQGNLLYTDFSWNGVYRLDAAGMVKRVVGIGGWQNDFGGDGGAASAAKLSEPRGLGYDSKGNLYIADYLNHRVRKVNPAGTISTFAGTGTGGFSGDGGPAASAQLNGPFELVIDAQDNVFVFELTGRRIRRITSEGRIDTIAGGGTLIAQSGVEATTALLQPSFWIGLSTGAGGVLNLGVCRSENCRFEAKTFVAEMF